MKLKILFLTLLTFLFVGCAISTQNRTTITNSNLEKKLDTIAKEIASSIVKKSKIKIAVIHFTNPDKKISSFDMYVANSLEKRFAKMKNLKLSKEI